jgi:hypothetical protein
MTRNGITMCADSPRCSRTKHSELTEDLILFDFSASQHVHPSLNMTLLILISDGEEFPPWLTCSLQVRCWLALQRLTSLAGTRKLKWTLNLLKWNHKFQSRPTGEWRSWFDCATVIPGSVFKSSVAIQIGFKPMCRVETEDVLKNLWHTLGWSEFFLILPICRLRHSRYVAGRSYLYTFPVQIGICQVSSLKSISNEELVDRQKIRKTTVSRLQKVLSKTKN